MPVPAVSRRSFLNASAMALAASATALAQPAGAAAQMVGVKRADLPDLTIKEVKVYVIDRTPARPAPAVAATPGAPPRQFTEQVAAIVTNSGIEGNYTLDARYFHPNWSNLGWLEYARRTLPGKSVLDLPKLTSQWEPDLRRQGQLSYASAIDNCGWDILGKAVNLPVYRILGAYRDKVMAYGSSQHHRDAEDFVTEVKRCKDAGFKAYKIHPPGGTAPIADSYKLDMEICTAVRQAAGDDFTLMLDPVGVYDRYQALEVGRHLDQLGYVVFEDPLPTTDIEGLVELCAKVDVPVHIGEFLFSIADFADYIKKDALGVVRLIADNVGGISGSMRVGLLADAHGLECAPHNWGNPLDLAMHFHVELALPNVYWFEMPFPSEYTDRAYFKYQFRIDKDGYVPAPTEPGLGYPIDRAALDKITTRIDR